MELLTPPKETFLLEMGTDGMHHQSQEWLSEIIFRETEIHFLHNLLIKNTAALSTDQEASNLSGFIEDVAKEELKNLKEEIQLHESYLDKFITNNEGDEKSFREKHKVLADKFREMEYRYTDLKKQIFHLITSSKVDTVAWNETLKTIYNRRAVRKFQEKKIEKKIIEQLLDAGRMAPSAMNRQPWKFYVLMDEKKIKQISSEIEKKAENLFHLSLLPEGAAPDCADPVFHCASTVIFITAPKNNEWASLDTGMCAQNIMLAAKAMGLDTCPVGLGKFVEKTTVYPGLQIPEAEEVKLAIIVGYGKEWPKMHERAKNNAVFYE